MDFLMKINCVIMALKNDLKGLFHCKTLINPGSVHDRKTGMATTRLYGSTNCEYIYILKINF